MHPRRQRVERGRSGRPCGLCGSDDVVVVESRAVRRGLDWLNPAWQRHSRTYALCQACGAKQEPEDSARSGVSPG